MRSKATIAANIALLFVLAITGCAPSGTDSMAFGDYSVKKTAAGANSIENLAQMDDCIRRSDKSCETAMLLDGRAYLVEAGTLISGSETEMSIFCGTVRSGALVGKEVCLPTGAFK